MHSKRKIKLKLQQTTNWCIIREADSNLIFCEESRDHPFTAAMMGLRMADTEFQ